VWARGPHAAHFSYFGDQRIIAEQTANIVQKLQFINRYIELDNSVKLLSDYWANLVTFCSFVPANLFGLEARKREVTVGDVEFKWSMYFVVFQSGLCSNKQIVHNTLITAPTHLPGPVEENRYVKLYGTNYSLK
jgi:hypothetical protein